MMTRMKPFLAFVLASAAFPAFAEPGLVTAFPANHVTLARPPDRVRLQFSEPARVSDVHIRRSPRCAWALEPTGHDAAATVSLPLPYLMPGTYVVTWQRDGADGHGVRESTSFSVK
jgi:methionine-rich copper-binding protein CopC